MRFLKATSAEETKSGSHGTEFNVIAVICTVLLITLSLCMCLILRWVNRERRRKEKKEQEINAHNFIGSRDIVDRIGVDEWNEQYYGQEEAAGVPMGVPQGSSFQPVG
jgi:hypothetical protein